LLVRVKIWPNVKSLKEVLILFISILGLKVNFNKNMLVGVNMVDLWLTEAALVLKCKTYHLPLLYLGLSIGGDSRKLNFGQPLFHRIQSKLSG